MSCCPTFFFSVRAIVIHNTFILPAYVIKIYHHMAHTYLVRNTPLAWLELALTSIWRPPNTVHPLGNETRELNMVKVLNAILNVCWSYQVPKIYSHCIDNSMLKVFYHCLDQFLRWYLDFFLPVVKIWRHGDIVRQRQAMNTTRDIFLKLFFAFFIVMFVYSFCRSLRSSTSFLAPLSRMRFWRSCLSRNRPVQGRGPGSTYMGMRKKLSRLLPH